MGTFDSKQDFVKMEHEMLKFWEENQCFEKLRIKNKDHEPFRFLDGPITANNPMGIHHAWGRTIKDAFIRYKAMKGYSCHYRNGFDTQGLWVEVEVEKELGFANKKDIEDYGSDNFTKKCVERIKKFSGLITQQSKRLGQWMDRPWIDEISIDCPECGSKVSRVTEVGDVWLDAGVVPFTTLGYFKDKEKWKTYYPAEWVTEMREQVRLWFYSLLFMSVTFEGRAPYERVLAYNSVVAEDGSKFSKTGFMIKFDEAAEKLGADTIRYLFAGANVATDVRFGYNLGEEARRKLLSFWNIYVFFMTYAMIENPVLNNSTMPKSLEVTDRWLLARTDAFIKAVTDFMDSYKTADSIKAFEVYVDDVSNWYVRINRRRFWKQGHSENKHAAYWCLYKALKVMLQVMAPIIPFLTEHMWQNMVRVFESDSAESVHLSNWPAPIGAAEWECILEQTETVRKLIGMALRIRNENQLKVKQPLSCMYVVTTPENEAAIRRMPDIIKDELNVKEIVFLNDCSSLNTKYLTLNFKKAGSVLKEKTQALKLLLDKATKDEMAAMMEQFQIGEIVNVPGWSEGLARDFFIENTRCKENIAVAIDKDITVALDTALSEDLVLEGLYRELLRQCQLLRKEAGLQVEQCIYLAIKSDFEMIKAVIEKYAKNIAEETLAIRLIDNVVSPIIAKEVDVGEYTVLIQIGI